MAKQFILPDLGEGIHEAQVVNVMIREGDTVTQDQMVMEVETDKASVELPVPYAGRVSKLNVKVGDTISVGQVLLEVEAAGEMATAAADQPPGPDAGVPATAPAADTTAAAPAEPPPDYGPGPVPAAPAVRRLARELGVDLRQVRGSGPGGRILREDVERFQAASSKREPAPAIPPVAAAVRPTPATAPAPVPVPATTTVPVTKAATPPPPPAAALAAEALPDFAQWGPIRREKVPQIRKTIARQMARAWSIIPHVTHGDEADVTDLEIFRKEQGKVFAEQGAKLTLTAFILKAVAGGLRQFPQFNASYDDAAGELIYKDYIHLGVAVDTPRGLMVPVLREVDRKGLVTISRELKVLADRAREFKLDVAEMRGGTFTITNVGALGGQFATPMINWPEVAILGLGKLAEKPMVRNGEIVVRKMLPLFLSFDHRVIDGADGARFVNTIATFLENPLNLLLVS